MPTESIPRRWGAMLRVWRAMVWPAVSGEKEKPEEFADFYGGPEEPTWPIEKEDDHGS